MIVYGALYDGASSKRREATLEVAADGTIVVSVEGRRARSALLTEVDVSPRVGATPRTVRFSDGAVFETRDNDAIDRALAAHAGAPGGRWLDAVESRWPLAALALLVVGGTGWWVVARGVPWLAERVAHALPAAVERTMADGALRMLDGPVLQPSELDGATRERVRGRFADVVSAQGQSYELSFRRSAAIGANAFALPAGTIIVTDELVDVAANDDEIVAVLAHEVGHVVHRHSVRQALQSSTVALLALAITNDASSVSSVVAGLPALLVQTKFSRDFEREADAYARELLEAKGIAPEHLASLLARIEARQGGQGGFDFLSTHPALEERAARLTGEQTP